MTEAEMIIQNLLGAIAEAKRCGCIDHLDAMPEGSDFFWTVVEDAQNFLRAAEKKS